MRGLQLGAALGARVTSAPTDTDWHWAERVVLVKHAWQRWAARARALRIPIVWDALDFWKQPDENSLTSTTAVDRLHRLIDAMQPTLMIGATEAMAAVAGGICLPHHGRIGLEPTPAREQIRVIGYDGNPIYLAQWAPALASICAARGWTFAINPPNLADVDVLVALRGGMWDGWMCREWKSGVKLVNAICAGRPILTQDTAAWREIHPAGTVIQTVSELPAAIEEWTPFDRRQTVVTHSRLHTRAPYFTVEAMAARYQDILARVSAPLEAAC